MRAYFKKDAEAACKYCEHGVPVPDGTAVLCEKIGGVMQPYSKCRRFKYDPLIFLCFSLFVGIHKIIDRMCIKF